MVVVVDMDYSKLEEEEKAAVDSELSDSILLLLLISHLELIWIAVEDWNDEWPLLMYFDVDDFCDGPIVPYFGNILHVHLKISIEW